MDYFCKKCGYKCSDLWTLVNNPCTKGGNHEAYEGHEKGPYHCKKCGYQSSDFWTLVNNPCSKGGNHEAM